MIRGEEKKRTVLMNLDRFEVVEKEALLILSNGRHTEIRRQGISTGPAVSILPYFRSANRGWSVLLVSEYRPMVNQICLEAPGGLLEASLTPEEQMVKVVRDEIGVVVPQNLIRLVSADWLANSFADQKVWQGTVEIEVGDSFPFEGKLRGRSDPDGKLEVTEVVIEPLAELLENINFKISYSLTKLQLMELGLHLGLMRWK